MSALRGRACLTCKSTCRTCAQPRQDAIRAGVHCGVHARKGSMCDARANYWQRDRLGMTTRGVICPIGREPERGGRVRQVSGGGGRGRAGRNEVQMRLGNKVPGDRGGRRSGRRKESKSTDSDSRTGRREEQDRHRNSAQAPGRSALLRPLSSSLHSLDPLSLTHTHTHQP